LSSELRLGYDEWGRLKELISYSADGAMTGKKVVNEYDKAGRRVRVTTEKFYAGSRSTWITTYEFDGLGNWVKELINEDLLRPRVARAQETIWPPSHPSDRARSGSKGWAWVSFHSCFKILDG